MAQPFSEPSSIEPLHQIHRLVRNARKSDDLGQELSPFLLARRLAEHVNTPLPRRVAEHLEEHPVIGDPGGGLEGEIHLPTFGASGTEIETGESGTNRARAGRWLCFLMR